MAKEMAGKQRGLAMVVLGLVAVIAIVGLVLLFVNHKNATGKGIYGGAIKGDAYPYWSNRGVPQNRPLVDYAYDTEYQVMTSHWNWEGNPKRNPLGGIPSSIVKCGRNGILISYSDNLPMYYASLGYQLIETPEKAGICAYPPGTMVGGVAGRLS